MAVAVKKLLLILLTPLTILGISVFAFNAYLFPTLEAWTKKEIHDYTEKNLPFVIDVDRFNIYLLRPSLAIREIRITPKPELAHIISPIVISETRAFLDIFKLMVGRLEISFVAIDNISMKLELDPLLEGDSKPRALPIDDLYKTLEQIPLGQVILKNSQIQIESKKNKFKTQLSETDLFIGKHKRSLDVVIKVPQTELSLEDKKLRTSFGIDVSMIENKLRLQSAYLSINESQLRVNGEVHDLTNVMLDPKFSYNLHSSINLASAQTNLTELLKNIPHLQGSIEVESFGELKTGRMLENHFSVNTKQVSVGNFAIGSAELRGQIKNNHATLSNISVEHPSGHAILQQTDIALTEPYQFKTKVLASQFSLEKLFNSIDLPDVPVDMLARGESMCSGQLTQGFSAQCDARIESNYLLVSTEKKKGATKIIELEEIKANGHLDFNLDRMLFNADLELKKAQGKAQGEVRFREGFNITFNTDPIDFKEIKELGGLRYQGQISLNGVTKGNSSAATFEAKARAQNFVLEDYRFGSLGSNIKYEKGVLSFNDTKGSMNQTEYAGNIAIDFMDSRIEGQMKSEKADLVDIGLIVENKVKLPFVVRGSGPIEAYFQGPMNFWNMDLKVQSHFTKGTIGYESFDRLQVNMTQSQGILNFDDVYLVKNRSRLNVTGQIQGAQEKLNLKLSGTSVRIEESETIGRVSSSLFGSLNVIGELNGTFKDPLTRISGTLNDTVIDDQEFPSSSFELKFLRSHMEGQANILGNKIQSEFSIPFHQGSSNPFLLKMKTINWSYSSVLSLIGASGLQSQYETLLTSEIDLRSESGDPLRSTGKIVVDQFLLKRGELSLKNTAPLSATFLNGQGNLKNFVLEGPQNKVVIEGNGFSAQDLNLTVQSQVSLRLLHVIVPFLEELNGQLDLSARLAGSLEKPEIFGTAKVKEGFVKLKGFPHSLEKLDGDLSFSHSKVLISNVKGQLSGGLITGEGQIQIQGLKSLPTQIKIKLQNVNLQVPDGVKTIGDGDLLFSGNWFPFTLSGVYNVSSAYIDKEFGGEEAAGLNARQSVYLPKSLKENSFEPLLLDLQVIIGRNAVIKNKLVDGTITGELQVKGPPSSPLLFGKINLEKTSKLNFRDKIFEVQTGLLQFNDPQEINPELYISANSRVNEYDINLLVQGPSKNLIVKTTSSPPLSEQDIFSLLALGVTSSKLDQSFSSNAQQQQTGYEIGSAIISQSGIDRQFREKLGVTFQFGSYFDSTKNITVPKITLSRNIRKKLDASFSRTLGEQNVNEARLQYSINNNVSAIGSWQAKEVQEGAGGAGSRFNQKETEILGIDLEYKKEFK